MTKGKKLKPAARTSRPTMSQELIEYITHNTGDTVMLIIQGKSYQ